MDAGLILGLLAGAALSGVVNGFAGFGTALFASAVWYLVLPFEVIAPLVVLSAFASQIVGLVRLRRHLSFSAAMPLISGGILGVPIGTILLLVVSPNLLKVAIAVFLIGYAIWQMIGEQRQFLNPTMPIALDRVVGFFSGIFGGLAGLAGPLPIVWLQLQNLPARDQRARYQPFNLAILGLSLISMIFFGLVTQNVLTYAALSLPATLLATVFGVWLFQRTSDDKFRRWLLRLLMVSGVAILLQSAA